MLKTALLKTAVTAAATGVLVLGAAGVSDAATLPQVSGDTPAAGQANGVDHVPSLNLDAQRFNCGGAALGYGAASLVSSAYLGVGTSVIDAGKYVASPDAIHFVNHPSDGPSSALLCR